MAVHSVGAPRLHGPARMAAVQAAAAKLDKINHLNLTPDLLKTLVQELATERSGS